MKLPYSEGTWFAIPLRDDGYAIGVVARATKKGKVILCYFFGPKRTFVPKLPEMEELKPEDALRVIRIGDLSLLNGEWPIIGKIGNWERPEWLMPAFVRREILTNRVWRVEYSDRDPNKIEQEIRQPYESDLEADGLYGAGAVEILLTRLLNETLH